MSEYVPSYADPENYKRMGFDKKDHYAKAVSIVYLWKLDIYTKEEFDQWRKKVEQQFKDRESSWWTRLIGQLWYRLFLPKVEELTTPKQIFKMLSQIDKLIKYLPESKWVNILKAIDWVADLVYKSMD